MSNLKIEFNIDSEKAEDVNLLFSLAEVLRPKTTPPVPTTTPASGATTKKDPAKKKTQKKDPADIEVVEAETVGTGVTIEDIRDIMGKKLVHHREAAKAKLKSLKANNVTSLDKGKYQEFYSFLCDLQDPI